VATFLRLLASGVLYRAAHGSVGLTRAIVALACWVDPVPGRRPVLPLLPVIVTDRSESTDGLRPGDDEIRPNLYDVLSVPASDGINLGPRRPRPYDDEEDL
jgi:hypothetical protein